MRKKDFNNLLTSVRQMGAIMKGKKLRGMRVTYRAKPASAQEVQKVRKELRLTQEDFAHVVGESPSAVRHWEQGIRTPRGAAAKLIRVLKTHPELVSELHLGITKPTLAEARVIEAAVKRADKSGGWISAEELIKKHRIR